MDRFSADVDVLVIGAGPTGLGAAFRLDQLGATAGPTWQLVEQSAGPGGLAGSVVDDAGFTWDLGGHVLYSHYDLFDRLLDDLVGDWEEHERAGYVRTNGTFVPYPIQRNLHHLSPADVLRCLEGLLEIHGRPPPPPGSFETWLHGNFGPGLVDVFFRPFNSKMWGRDPAELSCGWTRSRSGSRNANVPLVDLRQVLRGVVLRTDDPGWDGSARFRYPAAAGTGAIWSALADRLPAGRISYDTAVVAVDARGHRATLADGSVVRYDSLISSMPLDGLLRILTDEPELTCRADDLDRVATHLVGIGFDEPLPAELRERYWLYFPDSSIPFHRLTVLSNYAAANVARPGAQWSVLCEVNDHPGHRRAHDLVREECVAAVLETFGVRREAIATVWSAQLDRGYPVPTGRRDEVLADVQPRLRARGILSRGRFGGWRYEVSNQDHSFMQGVEAVDHLMTGRREVTYDDPEVTNAAPRPDHLR